MKFCTQEAFHLKTPGIPDQQRLQDLVLNGINQTQLAIAANDAQTQSIGRHLQAQTLEGQVQEALIGAELALADARKQAAQAAGVLAENKGAAGGLPPVPVTITIENMTVGAGTDQAALMQELKDAAQQGVMQALAQSAASSPLRIDSNVAGGR